jgi:hypothetical protein
LRSKIEWLGKAAFMNVPLVGAEYTNRAVGALIEKPDALHLIHQYPKRCPIQRGRRQ